MFVDQVKITVLAGNGGHGCLSFRRERGVPKGGPDGGRGGDGGSVFIESYENVGSLVYFRFHPINKARRGSHGEGGNRSGKRGEDITLNVPVGTVVREEDSDRILFDFTEPGQSNCVAKGGAGGRGNASFASSTRQTPRFREEGKPGEEKILILELKLIADVGLVGFPNVGKSTLISRISAARPVIADYPFTTLIPNLGVVDLDEFVSFVVADIPGLIEGAHRGHGLGIKFLKHVERTKILAHIIDVSPYSERDPVQDYWTVFNELKEFNPDLLQREQIIIANKIDLFGEDIQRRDAVERLAKREGLPFLAISAIRGTGLKAMVSLMFETLKGINERERNGDET